MALNKFISTQGYKSDSPDKNNPYNIIPSGRITMNNVPHPVYGIDNLGNSIYMQPGGEYQFPGDQVFEVPMHMMPDGTMMPNSEHPGYEEMELTDEEIAQYRAGGYIVEMQDGGQTTRTIPVSNPDDPRLHMYLDSLNLYKGYQKAQELFPEEKFPGTNPSSRWSEQMRARPNDKLKEQNYWDPNFQDPDINYFNSFDESWAHKAEFDKLVDKYKEGPLGSTNWDKLQADPMYKRIGANKMTAYKNTKDLMQDETKSGLLSKYYDENLKFRYPTSTGYWNTPDLGHSKIKQSDSYYSGAWNPIYKKPVQPYEYIGDPADVEALRHPAKISGVTNWAGKPSGTTDPKFSVAVNLRKRGMDSSFDARKKLAEEAGITNYTGSKEQNISLNDYIFNTYEGDKKKVNEEISQEIIEQPTQVKESKIIEEPLPTFKKQDTTAPRVIEYTRTWNPNADTQAIPGIQGDWNKREEIIKDIPVSPGMKQQGGSITDSLDVYNTGKIASDIFNKGIPRGDRDTSKKYSDAYYQYQKAISKFGVHNAKLEDYKGYKPNTDKPKVVGGDKPLIDSNKVNGPDPRNIKKQIEVIPETKPIDQRTIIDYKQIWDPINYKWIQEPIYDILPTPKNKTPYIIQDGGEIQELTDAEIASMRAQGYRIDIL